MKVGIENLVPYVLVGAVTQGGRHVPLPDGANAVFSLRAENPLADGETLGVINQDSPFAGTVTPGTAGVTVRVAVSVTVPGEDNPFAAVSDPITWSADDPIVGVILQLGAPVPATP